ncbi:hypothetical protein B566_EDAN015031, partial [Ephemera danica]
MQSPRSVAWSRSRKRTDEDASVWPSATDLPPSNPSKNWQTAIKVTKGLISLSRRTRRPVAWRAFSEVSVAGVAAALDRRSPPLRRLLWAVCLDRVNRYVAEPINVNVKITHNDSLEYPAITLVPPNATDAKVNISLLVGVGGMTPDTLWTLLSQRRDIFFAECWFGRGVTCDEQGKWTPVHTVMGPCYTYMINNTHVSAVGGFHNLYMNMRETTPTVKDDSGVRILVHQRLDSPVLAARTSSMSAELGWSREVKLELRKILNTEKSPCKDDIKYSAAQCELNCFQQFMLENLVFEQITEEKAYPLISLLCDIGGTLGLLMGASVLTVCELLEVGWSHLLQHCCRLEERKPPQTDLKNPAPPTISKVSRDLPNAVAEAAHIITGKQSVIKPKMPPLRPTMQNTIN